MRKLFLLLSVLTLAACERETSWHQRLTIVVETPTGEVSGSSVSKVVKTETSGPLVLPEARGVRSSVIGEAVVIEVTPGRYLFALLSGSDEEKRDATHWVYPAYNLSAAGSYSGAMSIVKSQPYDMPVPLPPEGWPMMVAFDDIGKPETVRKVNPNDLAESFGPGVKLSKLTIEITNAKDTVGSLATLLKWLCSYQDKDLRLSGKSGAIFDNDLSNNLAAGNFLLGVCK